MRKTSGTSSPKTDRPVKGAGGGRLCREAKTLEVMTRLYCRGVHGSRKELCPACKEILEYGLGRLRRCRFGEGKPVCARCPVHCYKPSMRDGIRRVMRYSGPRLMYRHPILALLHLLDTLDRVGPR